MSTELKQPTTLTTRVYEGIAWRLAKRSSHAQKHWRHYLTKQRLTNAPHPNLAAAAQIPGWLSAEEAETLNHFSRLAPEGHFLEIGSFCGRSSVIIGGVIAQRNNPTHKLFCCDPFGNVGKAEETSTTKRWAQRKRSSFETFRRNILNQNLEQWIVTLAGKSDDILPLINHHYTFIFVDGAHDYDSVTRDIGLVTHKVQSGGYILFHDATSTQVNRAINDHLDFTQFKEINHPSGSIAIYQRIASGENA